MTSIFVICANDIIGAVIASKYNPVSVPEDPELAYLLHYSVIFYQITMVITAFAFLAICFIFKHCMFTWVSSIFFAVYEITSLIYSIYAFDYTLYLLLITIYIILLILIASFILILRACLKKLYPLRILRPPKG